MRLLLITLMIIASTISFADALSQDVVTVTNLSDSRGYIKLIEPNHETECTNEIEMPANRKIVIKTGQIACVGKKFRLRAYTSIDKHTKTSRIFSQPGHCAILINTQLDSKNHVDCY